MRARRRRRHAPAPLRRRAGFALIAVLWVLVVIGVVVAEFHRASSAGRLAAINARDATRARWTARAGLARTLETVDRLLASDTAVFALARAGDTVLPPLEFDNDGVRARVVVLDERARLHLNLATDAQLRRFFLVLGFPDAKADSLADAILDWRDADDLHRTRGAEAPLYLEAEDRPASRPANSSFDAVDELRSVWGMTPAIYARIAPHLTVGGDGLVNVNSASAPVLQTLPAIGPEAVEAILRRRRTAPFNSVIDLAGVLPAAAREQLLADMDALASRVEFRSRDVLVIARATPPGATVHAELRAAVRLAGGSARNVRHVVER